jgi:hypothetical protein
MPCSHLHALRLSDILVQAAIRTSILQLDYSPAFALLLAYKYYEPAVR